MPRVTTGFLAMHVVVPLTVIGNTEMAQMRYNKMLMMYLVWGRFSLRCLYVLQQILIDA